MFDLFRKRGTQSSPVTAKPESPAPTESFTQSRQGAMMQAEELAHDEVAATEFILHCEFADARFKAAENIHSRPQVERVLQAMRNTDRRVAKLMQARLDVCKQWEADEQHARQCLEEARLLVQSSHLLPSQVASLDKAWQQVRHIAPPLQEDFDSLRAVLRERLSAQARLQRAVIDALARLRALKPSLESEAVIAALEQEVAQHAAAPEAAALPRNLLIEFEESAANLRRTLQAFSRHQQALEARHDALARWDASEPAALKPEVLKREWQALPDLNNSELLAPLQERFDALLKNIAVSRQTQSLAVEKSRSDVQEQYAKALEAMEKALQEGALQAAAEHDKHLRAINAQALRGSAKQMERLQQARAELHRLQGWARWGGQVSREELLHAAQALPGQGLPVTELAKKIGSLRERWKSLDVSAGPAGKELWQSFDLACTTAYAPAAAHFKQLANEREQNARQAQALIEEARQFVIANSIAKADPAGIDWKSAVQFSERMRHGWQRLGAIARQDRKKLDADFEAVLQPLSEKLAQQREREVHQREKLIAEVAGLPPQARGTLDTLRALQERWQQHAKALPLARKQEQELWQRFRQACDTVFAKRKEVSQAADADRRQHLVEKEALCTRLEAAQTGSAEAVAALLREARAAWDAIGAVPRAAEQQIDARHRQAVRALQHKLDTVQRRKAHDTIDTLQRKLGLCQTLEQQLVSSASVDLQAIDRVYAEWQTLSSLPGTVEKPLTSRLEAIVGAIRSETKNYAVTLAGNQPALQHELLRLEIVCGLESPPELMRERLQLQVAVLQFSFKSGQKTSQQGRQLDMLAELCRLPALADQPAMERIGQIIATLKKA